MVHSHHVHDETPRVGLQWRQVTPDERYRSVERALRDASDGARFRLISVNDAGEILLASSSEEEVRPGEEGAQLMAVEQALRAALGQPIEVYFQQRQDENKPRQNREVILTWIQARETLRTQALHESEGPD